MSTIGGTNSNSMLLYIDYEGFKSDPKIVVGYSDVTAILLALDRMRHSFLNNAVKADDSTLKYTSGSFSDDEQYLYATENFENYDGKAKITCVICYL